SRAKRTRTSSRVVIRWPRVAWETPGVGRRRYGDVQARHDPHLVRGGPPRTFILRRALLSLCHSSLRPARAMPMGDMPSVGADRNRFIAGMATAGRGR